MPPSKRMRRERDLKGPIEAVTSTAERQCDVKICAALRTISAGLADSHCGSGMLRRWTKETCAVIEVAGCGFEQVDEAIVVFSSADDDGFVASGFSVAVVRVHSSVLHEGDGDDSGRGSGPRAA